jgi:hypothetical protein
MSMQTKFTELLGVISAAQRSATKLDAGVRVEATRGRSSLSEASKLIVELRKNMLQAGKDVPKKTRAKKVASQDDVEPGGRDDDVAVEEIPPMPELKRDVTDMPELEKPPPKKKTGRKPKKTTN